MVADCYADSKDYDLNSHFDATDISTWQPHYIGWAVAGLLALSATLLSFHLIIQHLRNFTAPSIQRHICRILLMVPIYSIGAWTTYRFYRHAVYIDLIRSVYESFVIYEFFKLICVYLSPSPVKRLQILSEKPKRRFLFPLCFLTIHPASPNFLMDLKISVVQYVVIRPLMVLCAVILNSQSLFCPNSLSPRHGRFWFAVITSLSTAIAMYALVMMYVVIKKDISIHRPVTKFIAVKFVIFMTFWQNIVIGLIVGAHFVHATDYWTVQDIATGAQSFLICFEMFVASLLHLKISCFGYRSFSASATTRTCTPVSFVDALRQSFDPTELFFDLATGFRHILVRAVYPLKVTSDTIPLNERPMEKNSGALVTSPLEPTSPRGLITLIPETTASNI